MHCFGVAPMRAMTPGKALPLPKEPSKPVKKKVNEFERA
jgi:hypothetical protein